MRTFNAFLLLFGTQSLKDRETSYEFFPTKNLNWRNAANTIMGQVIALYMTVTDVLYNIVWGYDGLGQGKIQGRKHVS